MNEIEYRLLVNTKVRVFTHFLGQYIAITLYIINHNSNVIQYFFAHDSSSGTASQIHSLSGVTFWSVFLIM